MDRKNDLGEFPLVITLLANHTMRGPLRSGHLSMQKPMKN